MNLPFEQPLPLSPVLAPVLSAVAVALAAATLLPALAERLGWVDAAGAGEAARKLQRRPVAAVGGTVILLGVLAGWVLLGATGRGPDALVPGRALGQWLGASLGAGATLFPLGAVLAVFAVGLIDDLAPRGLPPGWKLLGQAASGALLGAPLLWSTAVTPAAALCVVLLLALGAVVCTNAINTFDNADGAAASLAAVALAGSAPMLAAPVLVFLPFNLLRRAGGRRGRGEPAAYLGDSGSHLLGLFVLLTPAAWPVLALPLADLARLCVVRARAGGAPWVGDRRHLAHRFAAGGMPRLAVPAVLVALALPSVLLGWVGVPLTLALVALAVRRTRAPVAAGACPGPSRLARAARVAAERGE